MVANAASNHQRHAPACGNGWSFIDQFIPLIEYLNFCRNVYCDNYEYGLLVAEKLGVSTSLLGYWKKKCNILQASNNREDAHFFTRKDKENREVIHYLVQGLDFPLKVAK